VSGEVFDERFAEFVAKTIRGPKFGAFEQLVAQHLVAAVASDPLRKIRLVCEAAYMCNPEKLNIDLDRLEVTYKVATSLINVVASEGIGVIICAVPWAFPPSAESFRRFIKPWWSSEFLSYTVDGTSSEVERVEKELNAMAEDQRFFNITMGGKAALTVLGYRSLVSQFVGWAMPFVQQVFEKVSRTVSPTVYNEVLRMMARTGEGFPRERGRREASMGERG